MKKKGNKEKTEREMKKMKAKRRYEKQGIGEQGKRKTEKEEKEMRGESFFEADKKGDHEKMEGKGRFDKVKAKK